MADDLTTEVKDRFQYCVDQWRRIREEARLDMRFVSGDPWDPAERKARKEAGRPCIALDELNQYVNDLVNDVRQNKRSIRVLPKGGGATDQSAEIRQGLIREIEYKSNAQAAYSTAFQDTVTRSYGAFRISKRYVGDSEFDQELCIKRIPNPDTVYFDPDAKEVDCSDGRYAFVLERMSRDEFKRKWPKAQITDFSSELISSAPHWIGEKDVQVAEYWRVETKRRRLVLLGGGQLEPLKLFSDEIPPELIGLPVAKERWVDFRTIRQYITNGVEILEENDWDGKYIPLVPMFGKELWLDDGSGSRRVLMSLIRLARDPYMLYCYYRTCEMELIGQVPKIPYMGYEGQFEGHEAEFQNANRIPTAYLQVKPTIDAASGQILPLPRREMWEPPVQQLELGAESARRAIQAAMGITALPTAAQRQNEKSGVALQRIQQQASHGSFHFIDNYDRALEHAGRILDDLIDKTYDVRGREVGIRTLSDQHAVIRLNSPEPQQVPGRQEPAVASTDGDHDVIISTGPSYQSQREEASDFADLLTQNQMFAPRIIDLAIKLKQLGPIGDEMAKRLAPPDASQDGQMSPAQIQALVAQHEALTQQLNAVTDELRMKKAELESRERIAELNATVQVLVADMKNALTADVELLRQQVAAISAGVQTLQRSNSPAGEQPAQVQP